MLHTHLRHFITSFTTSYINNDIWIGIFWQWLGNNSLATSKGPRNGSGATLHTPTTIKQQKKVKLQQQICWIPGSIWHVQMQCKLNIQTQHKITHTHTHTHIYIYSKLFVDVSKYKYLEKALVNKNEGHYEVQTINSRNACDYYQIQFVF